MATLTQEQIEQKLKDQELADVTGGYGGYTHEPFGTPIPGENSKS